MPHSHLPVKHLLKALETSRPALPRDIRPAWLVQLTQEVSELFEPCAEVARVGFNCRPAEDRWEVDLYLGAAEIIGGREDGSAQFVNFRFDLLALIRNIDPVERFEWRSISEPGPTESDAEAATVLIEGAWQANPVRLRLHSVPPSEAGPGLRRYPDGSWAPT